ncbi:MAG: type III pantothenate kinase [Alphaproteobacteria bacterium]|nr:type III pantothenate kinase [Alphaproteobacteria bacterium]
MLLAINSNNTNIKFALYDGETQRGHWRIATDPKRTADEYAVWISQLLALENFTRADVTAAIIASVVPNTTQDLETLCRTFFKIEPMTFGRSEMKHGAVAKVDRPEEVGADRLINALAAHIVYGGPCIVVDLGTATTFDVVDEDGAYCGGSIAPGVRLSVDALRAAAALLPRVAIEPPERVIGRSTIECLKSGTYWGYVSLMEGLVARIKKEYGAPEMKVIATGGLAPLFDGATDCFDAVDMDLTMRGLVSIARLNDQA